MRIRNEKCYVLTVKIIFALDLRLVKCGEHRYPHLKIDVEEDFSKLSVEHPI